MKPDRGTENVCLRMAAAFPPATARRPLRQKCCSCGCPDPLSPGQGRQGSGKIVYSMHGWLGAQIDGIGLRRLPEKQYPPVLDFSFSCLVGPWTLLQLTFRECEAPQTCPPQLSSPLWSAQEPTCLATPAGPAGGPRAMPYSLPDLPYAYDALEVKPWGTSGGRERRRL